MKNARETSRALFLCWRKIMKKPYLEAGKIVGTHGVRGEFKIQPWCDSAAFLCGFQTLYLDDAGQKPLKMQSLRPHKNVVLAKADGVTSIELAEALRGKILYISRADAHLEEGKWFVQDLLSCKVIDIDTDEEYGVLTEVIPGVGANDVWCVKSQNGEETLVPAIPDVVLETDIDAGVIRIRPLSGLFDGKETVVRDAD